MTERGWFGFRVVTRPKGGPRAPGIWHGFRSDAPGATSLCGRVSFRSAVRSRGGRACAICAAAWSKKYPKETTT